MVLEKVFKLAEKAITNAESGTTITKIVDLESFKDSVDTRGRRSVLGSHAAPSPVV